MDNNYDNQNYNNYNYQNNIPKKSNGNPLSGIMSLILIGAIIYIGLIGFNVVDNPFTFMKDDNDKTVEISPKEISVSLGGSYQIETVKAPGIIEYKSSDPTIADVNEYTGYIFAKKSGTATITAYLKDDNSIKDECIVTVESTSSNVEVQSISLNKKNMYLSVGGSGVLSYSVSPTNANIKKIYWSTSNKNIATVDKYGKVVGVKEGTATITIRTENGSTDTCTVSVSKKQNSPKSQTTNTTTPTTPTVTFTLTYNANGGSVTPTSKELNQGSEYGSFPTPTRNGYTFTGWYTKQSGGTKVNSSTKIYGNTTIYAQWEQNGSGGGGSATVTTYTLTYNANGGTVSPTSKKLEKGSVYGTLPTPTRSGYTFDGWYTAASGGNKVSASTTITGNTTIYAHWTKNSDPTPQNKNVTKITVSESTMKTKTNSKKAISYTVEPSTANNKDVTFKSSNEKIAKVDASGNVTGIGSGLATITITSQENSKITAKVNVVVDYSFFDNCKTEKANTLVSVKSTSSRNIGVYACIENQEYFQQGFAVSDNYIYTVNLRYGTWCKKGETKTFKLRGQTELTANCDPSDNNTILYISGNRIYRTSKSGAVDTINYLDLGGHGQAFDVSNNDEIYANYFPHATYHDYYGYGGGPSGVAIFKFGSDKTFVDPKLAIKVYNDGNIKKFTYEGNTSQHQSVLEEGKKSDSIRGWMELAVDESNDQIAIMDRAKTSNNNNVLYVYKLSQFKAGNKQLVRKVYIGRVCGENNILCASQGIELKGNYLYTVQEYNSNNKHYESVTKIDLSSCPTSDITTKCSKVENLNIPDSIYTKGDRKFSEVEGISINKNKVYISVIDKSSSTNKTYENILLLDGF